MNEGKCWELRGEDTVVGRQVLFCEFGWNEMRGSEAGGSGGDRRREKPGTGGVTIRGKNR